MQVVDRAKWSKKTLMGLRTQEGFAYTLNGQLVLRLADQVRERVPFLSDQFYHLWERPLSPVVELTTQAMKSAGFPLWSL